MNFMSLLRRNNTTRHLNAVTKNNMSDNGLRIKNMDFGYDAYLEIVDELQYEALSPYDIIAAVSDNYFNNQGLSSFESISHRSDRLGNYKNDR